MSVSAKAKNERIRVIVRLRPEHKNDLKRFGKPCVKLMHSSALSLYKPAFRTTIDTGLENLKDAHNFESERKDFGYDRVYGPDARQQDVFDESIEELVDSVVGGYNATIFAYGATGSGKTHTMMGTDERPGITPRAVQRLFELIGENSSKKSGMMFMVRMSFVELYNNNFRDLLEGSNVTKKFGARSKNKLREEDRVRAKIDVRENSSKGVYLTGSKTLRSKVSSVSEVMSLIRYGLSSRAVGHTNLNEHSSRSHSIMTLDVESREKGAGAVCMGKLHLVDLAGSERVSMSGAEGTTLRETQNINLSLAMLGNVLSALSSYHSKRGGSTKKPIVPYRHNKLTYLLRDSLGGNSKTCMITTIRCPEAFFQQTKTSLMYSSRAKKIENSTKINVDSTGASEMQKVASQVDELKVRLLERTTEFNRIRSLHVRSTKESTELKQRVREMARQNELEKQELQRKLNQVISNREEHTKELGHFEELQANVEEYQETVMLQRQEISQLKKTVEGREDEAQNLRIALQASQADSKRMRSQRDAAAKRLGDESDRIRQVVDEWQHQKKAMKSQILQLESEVQDARANEERVGVIKNEYANALREMDDVKEKLMREKILTEQKALEKSKAQSLVNELSTEVKQLKNELSNERKLKESNRRERQQLEEKYMKNISVEKDMAEKQISELKLALKKARSSNSSANKNHKEQMEKLQQDLEENSNQMSIVKRKLRLEESTSKKTQNRVNLQIQAFNEEIRKYKKLVVELESSNSKFAKKISDQDTIISKLKEKNVINEVNDKQNETQLGNEIKLRDAKISELREKRDKIQASLRKAMDTMIELQTHSQEKESICAKLREKIAGFDKLLPEKESCIQALQMKLTEIKNSGHATAVEDLDKAKISFNEKLDTLKSEKLVLSKRLETVEGRLVDATKSSLSDKVANERYKKDFEKISKELAEAKSSQSEIKCSESALEEEVTLLKNSMEALNKQLNESLQTNSEMKSQETMLKDRLNNLTQQSAKEKDEMMTKIESITENLVLKSSNEKIKLMEELRVSKESLEKEQTVFKSEMQTQLLAAQGENKHLQEALDESKIKLSKAIQEAEDAAAMRLREFKESMESRNINLARLTENRIETSRKECESQFAQELQRSLQENAQIFQKQIEEINENHKKALSDANAKGKEDTIATKQELRESLRQTNDKHASEIQKIRKEFSEELEKEKQVLETALSKKQVELEQITRSSQESSARKFQELTQTHENTVLKLKEEHSTAILNIQKETALMETAKIENVSKTIIENESIKWEQNLSAQEKKWSENYEKQLADQNRANENVVTQLKEELARVQMQFADFKKQSAQERIATDQLQKDKLKEIEALKNTYDNKLKQTEQQFENRKLENSSNLKDQYNKDLHALQENSLQKAKEMEATFNEKIELLRGKFAADRNEMVAKHEQRLVEITESATSKLLSTEQTWKSELDLTKQKLTMQEETVRHVKERSALEMSSLKRHYEDELKALKNSSSKELELLEFKQKDVLHTSIAAIKASHVEEIRALKAELQKGFEAQKSNSISELKVQCEKEKGDLKAQWDEKMSVLETKMTSQTDHHESAIALLKEAHQRDLNEAQRIKSEKLSKAEEEKESLIQKSEHEFKSALQSMALKAENERLQAINLLQSKHSEELKMASKVHAKESEEKMSELREEFMKKYSDLEEKLQNKYLMQQKTQKVAFHDTMLSEKEKSEEAYEALQNSTAESCSKFQIARKNYRLTNQSFRAWLRFTHTTTLQNIRCEMEDASNRTMATKSKSNRAVLSSVLKMVSKRYSQIAFYTWRKTALKEKNRDLSEKLNVYENSRSGFQARALEHFLNKFMTRRIKLHFQQWKNQTKSISQFCKCMSKLSSIYMQRKTVKAFFVWKQRANETFFGTTLNAEKNKLIKNHEIAINEMCATSQQLARENNDALVQISSEKQEEIAFLIKKHHDDKKKALRHAEKKHASIEKKYLAATKLLKEKLDEQSRKVKELSLLNAKSEELMKVTEEKYSTMSEMNESKISAEVQRQKNEYESQINSLKSAKEASESSLQTALNSQMKLFEEKIAALNELRKEDSEKNKVDFKALQNDCEIQVRDSVESTKEEMQKAHGDNVEKLKEDYEFQIVNLRKYSDEVCEKYEKQLEEAQANLEQERDEFAKKICEMEKDFAEKNRRSVAESVAKKCEEVQEQFSQMISEQENDFKEKINKTIGLERAKYDTIVAQMKEEILSEKEREIDELKSTLTGERDMQESMKDDMAQSQMKFTEAESTISSLKAQLKKMKSKDSKERNKQLQELEVKFTSKISSLEAAKESTEVALQTALKDQAKMFEERLKESSEKNRKNKTILRKALTDQVKAYEVKLATANQESSRSVEVLKKQIEEMKVEHQEELKKANNAVNDEVVKKFEEKFVEKDLAIKSTKEKHNKALKSIHDNYMDKIANIESSNTKYIRKMIMDHEELTKTAVKNAVSVRMESVLVSHDKEVKALKEKLVSAVEKYKELKENFEEQLKSQSIEHKRALEDLEFQVEAQTSGAKKALSDVEKHLEEATEVASRSQTDVRKKHYEPLLKVMAHQDHRCLSVKKNAFKKLKRFRAVSSLSIDQLAHTSKFDSLRPSSFAKLVSTPSADSTIPLEKKDRKSMKQENNSRTPQAWKGISLRSSKLHASPTSYENEEEEFIANIHSAAYDGELHELKKAVNSRPKIFSENERHAPNLVPIHRAITGLNYHGDLSRVQKCVSVLLDNGFNLNQVDENGNTVLMHALTSMPAKKSMSLLRNILSVPSVNVSHKNSDGESALHIEIRRMNAMSLPIIKMLVEHGADVNAESKDGLTPLTLCIVLSRRAMGSPSSATAGVWTGTNYWIPIVRYLISYKAAWIGKKSAIDHCGRNPLHLLLSMPPPCINLADDHVSIVSNCLSMTSKKININAQDRYGNTALLGFCKAIAGISQKGDGRAYYKWATQIIDSMLLRGADARIISRHGLSPLDMAGYWDLAPVAKNVRANGGTLYDLVWSQLALFTRRRDKENGIGARKENSAAAGIPHVKKINGLLKKADKLSVESHRYISPSQKRFHGEHKKNPVDVSNLNNYRSRNTKDRSLRY